MTVKLASDCLFSPWRFVANILGIILLKLIIIIVVVTVIDVPALGIVEKNSTLKASHCDGCMEDWFSYSNHCYHISTEKKNWTESRMACASKKSSLLIIENDEEMELMVSISSLSWIGLLGNSTSPDWFWINGSVFQTKKSVFKKTNHNCGILYSNGPQPDNCENSKTYICKYKLRC